MQILSVDNSFKLVSRPKIQNLLNTISELGGDSIRAIWYQSLDNTIVEHRNDAGNLENTFETISNTLSGVNIVILIDKHIAGAPEVNTVYTRGSDEHANEICATLTYIADDIFVAAENGQTFVAVCSDADLDFIPRLFN